MLTAIAIAWLTALGFFLVAALRGGGWDDRLAFCSFGGLAAYFAMSLTRREIWAQQACIWIGAISSGLFALGLCLIAAMVAANLHGSRDALVADPLPKLVFLAAWTALFVVAPGSVAYHLSRPSVRDWFAAQAPG